jgi:hypothetical protein
MENPMTARFWLFTDEGLLNAKMIPTLAAAAMTTGSSDPASLKRQLVFDKKDKCLTLSEDQFLVLAGTTAELKQFRARINAADVDAIGLKQRRYSGDPLVTWCARAKVKHPDSQKKLEPGGTVVTVLVIGRESLFLQVGSRFPKNPWNAFPHGLLGQLLLDDDFDNELEDARKLAKAN